MRNWVLLESAKRALEQARLAELRSKRLLARKEEPLIWAEGVYLQAYARELRRLVKHCEKRRLSVPFPTPTPALCAVPLQLALRGVS